MSGRLRTHLADAVVEQIDVLRAFADTESVAEPFVFGADRTFPVIEFIVGGGFFHHDLIKGVVPVIFVTGEGCNTVHIVPFGADTQMDSLGIVSISPLVAGHMVHSF
ncbi:hypothetical protein D3C73_1429070 [compost metagenome]